MDRTDTEHSCTELDEILSQIADLDKWREIFNSRGLELQKHVVKNSACCTIMTDYIELLQEDVTRKHYNPVVLKTDDDGDDSVRATLAQNQLLVPFSVPESLTVSPSLGGQPLSPEIAVNLRKILFGNTFHVFNYEWKKTVFKFREPLSEMSYALETERGGARAIQMVVQAHVIKYLLFSHSLTSDSKMQSMKEVGEMDQIKALVEALTDILWTAGEEQAATVCLVTSERCFTPNLDYKLDNFTERLLLFTFHKLEDVRAFISDHIQCFKEEGSHGVILFLYSLIFSRTIERIQADFDVNTSHLLHLSLGNFVCRQTLLNLLLTGRASANVFNGTLHNDEDGKPLDYPLHGVLTRGDVGYLLWNRDFDHAKMPQVGSMLKTPKLPIWVCNINGTYSVLFSPNRSLLCDWRMEHLFHLYFYNGQSTQSHNVLITIDTQSHHWQAESNDIQGDLEKKFPSLEMTIRTKWEGAVIDWNGTTPFF